MRRPAASDIVLEALGLLLLTAAALKGHELLTVPLLGNGLWSWRPFVIFQVEFELALGIWLISGVLKRLAWLAATACFGLFCCVTLYKGLTGAASCGCFGRVHVNPWITLVAVDLPAVVGLLAFRPVDLRNHLRSAWALAVRVITLPRRALAARLRPLRVHGILGRTRAGTFLVRPAAVVILEFTFVPVTTHILAVNQPPNATSRYEVLEPGTWVGRELPIVRHIDIGEQLRTGNWLVVLYHHGCPDCAKAISKYEEIARELEGSEDVLRIALVEVPPYGKGMVSEASQCTLGKIDRTKEWLVVTPAIMVLTQGVVKAEWIRKSPDYSGFMPYLAYLLSDRARSPPVTSRSPSSLQPNVVCACML